MGPDGQMYFVTYRGDNGELYKIHNENYEEPIVIDVKQNTSPNPTQTKVSHNPLNNSLNFTHSESINHIRVISTKGKILFESKRHPYSSLSTKNWAPGIYHIQVIDNSGQSNITNIHIM